MKAIFLTDMTGKTTDVYEEKLRDEIAALADADKREYSLSEIVSDKERFREVKWIFSTWGMPSIDKKTVRELFPNLEAIFYAAGSVRHFARSFLENGVRIFSAWAANAVPVAEFTVAETVLANKGYFAKCRAYTNHDTDELQKLENAYSGNYGVKVGLIGAGMIGSLVAEMLKSYKLRVLAYDPFLSDERAERLGVTKCGLDELFSSCSVISNHLANNDKTKGILGGKLFSLMPPYSTFINTGRGAQVVENELVDVLKRRPDITALLDVTDPEPADCDHPFYTLPNCVLTPHIAGSIENETHRMAEYMLEEFKAYISAGEARFEVTEKMLETMA